MPGAGAVHHIKNQTSQRRITSFTPSNAAI
jgi:hypothetical protein